MKQYYFRGSSLKLFSLICLAATAFSLQFCKSPKAAQKPAVAAVSYEKDLKPLMVKSCTPCHFPETGKKKMLDTYEAMKDNATDILKRVQMAPTDDGYMPFKSKKPALTPAEVQLLKDWMATGMAK